DVIGLFTHLTTTSKFVMTSQSKKNNSANQAKRGQPVKIKGKRVVPHPIRTQGKSDGKPLSAKPRPSRSSSEQSSEIRLAKEGKSFSVKPRPSRSSSEQSSEIKLAKAGRSYVPKPRYGSEQSSDITLGNEGNSFAPKYRTSYPSFQPASETTSTEDNDLIYGRH
ncbi:MAG: hypothetical protein ACK55I_21130, partial [bacterium]